MLPQARAQYRPSLGGRYKDRGIRTRRRQPARLPRNCAEASRKLLFFPQEEQPDPGSFSSTAPDRRQIRNSTPRRTSKLSAQRPMMPQQVFQLAPAGFVSQPLALERSIFPHPTETQRKMEGKEPTSAVFPGNSRKESVRHKTTTRNESVAIPLTSLGGSYQQEWPRARAALPRTIARHDDRGEKKERSRGDRKSTRL